MNQFLHKETQKTKHILNVWFWAASRLKSVKCLIYSVLPPHHQVSDYQRVTLYIQYKLLCNSGIDKYRSIEYALPLFWCINHSQKENKPKSVCVLAARVRIAKVCICVLYGNTDGINNYGSTRWKGLK